jgi:hypothetical protein
VRGPQVPQCRLDHRKALEVDAVEARVPARLGPHQSGLSQDAQVLAGGGLAEPSELGKLADRARALAAQAKEVTADRM